MGITALHACFMHVKMPYCTPFACALPASKKIHTNACKKSTQKLSENASKIYTQRLGQTHYLFIYNNIYTVKYGVRC